MLGGKAQGRIVAFKLSLGASKGMWEIGWWTRRARGGCIFMPSCPLPEPQRQRHLEKSFQGRLHRLGRSMQELVFHLFPLSQVVFNVQELQNVQQEEGWFLLRPDKSKPRQDECVSTADRGTTNAWSPGEEWGCWPVLLHKIWKMYPSVKKQQLPSFTLFPLACGLLDLQAHSKFTDIV